MAGAKGGTEMISTALLKADIKRNWSLLLIFFGVLTLYMFEMISIFDPEEMDKLLAMIDMFPQEILKAMGFSRMVTDLTGYLASWLYGLLMLGFPMVYCIILGNRLVARMVDNSSFAWLLSTPNSRARIIATQGVYALSSLALLFAALTAVGIMLGEASFPGMLDKKAFLSLNLTTMLVNMTVMMISYLFSCIFNETRNSLTFGAGIPIMLLLMNMLGGISDKVEVLKRFTIYGFYDPVRLVSGSKPWWLDITYAVMIAVLFTAAVLIFRKKRLPI